MCASCCCAVHETVCAQSCYVEWPKCAQITFVGTILSLDEQQSAVTYMLDDGSGQIHVKKWHSSDAGDANQLESERRAALRCAVCVIARCSP